MFELLVYKTETAHIRKWCSNLTFVPGRTLPISAKGEICGGYLRRSDQTHGRSGWSFLEIRDRGGFG